MVKIYHNPRCSKSREGVAILQSLNVDFEIIKYLDEPFTNQELRAIIKKLDITPIDLVRVKESIWKSDFKDKNLSDDDIVQAMLDNPRLIERPIVVTTDHRAVVGRPPEKIKGLF